MSGTQIYEAVQFYERQCRAVELSRSVTSRKEKGEGCTVTEFKQNRFCNQKGYDPFDWHYPNGDQLLVSYGKSCFLVRFEGDKQRGFLSSPNIEERLFGLCLM